MCSVRLPSRWCRGLSLITLITWISVADNDCSSDKNAVSYFLFDPTVIDAMQIVETRATYHCRHLYLIANAIWHAPATRFTIAVARIGLRYTPGKVQ